MKLLTATSEDAKSILDLETICSSKHYQAYQTISDVEEAIIDRFIYLLIHNDICIGHVICTDRGEHYHIGGLVIHPKYRGNSFSRLAIKELLQKFNDKSMTLLVHPQNIVAIITYLKNGFIISGYETNKLGDGEDRISMIKICN